VVFLVFPPNSLSKRDYRSDSRTAVENHDSDASQAPEIGSRETLEQFRPIRCHLMESYQSTQQGEQRRAILVSGKLFNDDDGLIWPTGGRFAALSGRRYACLVVG
jgi:hypothetical protein